MNKRLTAGVIAAVTAVSMSVPAVGLASKNGVARSPLNCTSHKHSGKHRGLTRGRKMGFKRNRGKRSGLACMTTTTASTTATPTNNGATHGHKTGFTKS